MVYISDDLHHNSSFVEFVNDVLHKYYQDKGIVIDHDIEFNDGCSAQYKSIQAFWLFTKQAIKTDHVFFESIHGKAPLDGVGGVTKVMCAAAVSGNKVLIRNAKEMYTYLHPNHTTADRPFQKGHISCRKYFYISDVEINQYHSSLGKLLYKTLKGTRKLHQISTSSQLKHNQMHVKKYSCLCISCQNSEHANYINFTTFQNTLKSNKKEIEDEDAEEDEDENKEEESDEDDEDEITWEESNAVQMIKEGDIVVVQSEDNYNPYYLICARSEVATLHDNFRDDFGHLQLKGQTVLSGNYLEEVQSKNENRLFFKDTGKVAVVSSFCIAGISPELIQSKGHWRKKVADYFEINEYCKPGLLWLQR